MMRSRSWAMTWAILRLVMAIAIVAAVVAQLVKTTETTLQLGKDLPMTIWNFFSFFTILSNVGAAVTLAWAAAWFVTRGRRDVEGARLTAVEPRGLAVTLASVTTYMVITGVVYNLLLRSIVLPQGSEPVPWSNEILHLVGPLFLVLDLLLAPARRALPWRTIWVIIAFPLVWTAYTLIRGPLVTDPGGNPPYWYPYPFLNPNNFDNGYLGIVPYVVGIAAGIFAVGFIVVWVGRRRGARSEAS